MLTVLQFVFGRGKGCPGAFQNRFQGDVGAEQPAVFKLFRLLLLCTGSGVCLSSPGMKTATGFSCKHGRLS